MAVDRGQKTLNKGLGSIPQLGAERVLGLFVNKWAIKVVHRLATSERRPGELRRLLRPISQEVLTHTLRDLERSGLVRRELVSLKPLSVRYFLTPLGRTFVKPLNELCKWAASHNAELRKIGLHRRKASRVAPAIF